MDDNLIMLINCLSPDRLNQGDWLDLGKCLWTLGDERGSLTEFLNAWIDLTYQYSETHTADDCRSHWPEFNRDICRYYEIEYLHDLASRDSPELYEQLRRSSREFRQK